MIRSLSIAALSVLPLLVLNGCSPGQIQRDIVLDRVVREATTRCKEEVRKNPRIFKSVDVRTENGDTLVLDYVVQPEAESRVQELHNEYMNTLQNNETHRDDFIKVADYGISVRVIYQNAAGESLLDTRITRDDL
jgi:hypothetical protein